MQHKRLFRTFGLVVEAIINGFEAAAGVAVMVERTVTHSNLVATRSLQINTVLIQQQPVENPSLRKDGPRGN